VLVDRWLLEEVQPPLRELPQLDEDDEGDEPCNGQAPLPADLLLLEDVGVEAIDHDNREDRERGDNDGEEQELVLPHVAEEVALRVEREHRPAQVLELPRDEAEQPGDLHVACRARLEDRFALGRVSCVAVTSEVATAGSVNDDDEGRKAQRTHDEAVHAQVDDDLPREHGARRAASHDVGLRLLEAKGERGEAGDRVDEQYLQRCDGEDGQVVLITEREADDE